MYLIYDTETTGKALNFKADYTDTENWPRIVQIAWELHDAHGKLINAENHIIKPEGFKIPFAATQIHGISTERAEKEGKPLRWVLERFNADLQKTQLIAGHNIVGFDNNVTACEFYRLGIETNLLKIKTFDTMLNTIDFVALPGGRGGGFKYPSLSELHQKLFGTRFEDAHDAAYDVSANAKCFFELFKHELIAPLGEVAVESIVYQAPDLDNSNFKTKEETNTNIPTVGIATTLTAIPYVPLHVHSMYSVLQSTASIKKMIKFVKEIGCKGLAITDLSNLYGALEATNAVAGIEDFKLIIGTELFLAKDRKRTSFTKDDRDIRFPQLLIAKNQQGYQNLCKLSSIGYIEGGYEGCSRIDKELLLTNKEGIIALSGSTKSIIHSTIINQGEDAGEREFEWWLNHFGENFYVCIQRHGIEEEDYINPILLEWCKKYKVKYVAANESFYMKPEDADVHDVLLCVKEGEKKSTPIGKGREHRFGFTNKNFYIRKPEEMTKLFADIPEALTNTIEIADKCQTPVIKRKIMLPKFELPKGLSEDDYLRELTYQGAAKRYPAITPEIKERLDFELDVIKKMGFPGYFLIVQDFINKGREMGVAVGPGRGSAAGSAVAFCTGITNIDPIAYNLLFERFLNPERVSMPDIDVDFDDRGRQRVIEYVVAKYGKNQVAQIITYGAMKAKSAIKDAGRVLEYPLNETNQLAKLIPESPDITFEKAFAEVPELKNIYENDKTVRGDVLRTAVKLEGCVRNVGVHAAGVIIAPSDLLDCVPVTTAKDAELLVTQFEGKVIEEAGMLKMDFLGLKTLTIIQDAIALIEKNHGTKIDIDKIPFDDAKTFELYQKGLTVGTFQFESVGMQKYLRELKPTNIEDLIAMNALYRPGPLQYIPNYINRKHGREAVEYPHPLLENILKPTYGIMIYQEQVMQAAQIMAGYSLGGADLLRRAMGKKKPEEMAKQREIFVKGAKEVNGIPEAKALEVFAMMEQFAGYGFNRSHAAAYSVVAYQTAYLKANYTAEYMAAVLSNSMGNLDKISEFLDECKNLGVEVLVPDVNESEGSFTVNKQGAIRFGLAAIKGAGEAAIESIIDERKKNGNYNSIFDFIKRQNLRIINKRVLEALVYSGAFDCFADINRAQYFFEEAGSTGIEKLIRYATAKQAEKNTSQASLFGTNNGTVASVNAFKLPVCPPWSQTDQLQYEKEVIGIAISGHPLDAFKTLFKGRLKSISQIDDFREKEIEIGGIILDVNIRRDKNDNEFALFTVQDYSGNARIAVFKETFLKTKHLLNVNSAVYVRGKVKERWNSPGVYELFPDNIKLLADLQENIKKIILQVPIYAISQQLITEIEALAQQSKGKAMLYVNIFDDTEKIKLNMFSKKYKLDPTPDVLKAFSKFQGIEIVTA